MFDVFEQQASQFNATLGKLFSGLQQKSQQWASEESEDGKFAEIKRNGKRFVWNDVIQRYVPSEYMRSVNLAYPNLLNKPMLQQFGSTETHGAVDSFVGFTGASNTTVGPAFGAEPGVVPPGAGTDFGPGAMP